MKTQEPYNPRLKALLLEAVDNQIKGNDPPAARQTMERLKDCGYSEQKAKEMIAAVLVEFIYDAMKYGKKYDTESYAGRLGELR